MRSVRRQIRRVAGSWLILQLLVMSWVPVALYASVTSESAVEECTCEHPAGGICPMHRHSSKPRTPPSAACSLRAAMDPLDALVASLIGTTGVPAASVVSFDPIETSDTLARVSSAPIDRLVPPDSPPPRA